MAKNAILGVPALVGEARRVLHMNQEELGTLVGWSKRTVQRWETKRSHPSPTQLAKLAGFVLPHDAELASDLAAAAGQTLQGLGLVAPPAAPAPPPPPSPPPPPPMPRHLAVDAVVCVAAESLGVVPREVRAALLAAFRRARELGLACVEVEAALDEGLRVAAGAAVVKDAGAG